MMTRFRLLCLTVAFIAAPPLFAAEPDTNQAPSAAAPQPGSFTWQPSASSQGPIVIVVDLSQQNLQVFQNGVQIGSSPVSSGVKNFGTPAGIFTIVQKATSHHSNLFHEASMPFMERLTWAGLAIHAGKVPGHPDSHGCVHVPREFAEKLYAVTYKGAAVLITQGENSPGLNPKPDLEFASGKVNAPQTSPTTPFVWRPDAAKAGPVSVVFSSADQEVHVYRNGVEIGRATTGQAASGAAVGNRIYTATDQTNPDGGHQWKLLGSVDSTPGPDAASVLTQLNIPAPFRDDMQKIITPGTTLVLTDEAVDGPKYPEEKDETAEPVSR